MPNNPGKATAPAITPVDQMRRLMDATFEGAFLHEAGVVLDANRAAAALFGRAVGELNRCCISELIAEESCKALMRQIHSRSSVPCPITARRKDGTDVPLEIVVKATLTCNGRRLEVLVISQNVTPVPVCRASRVRRVTSRADLTKN